MPLYRLRRTRNLNAVLLAVLCLLVALTAGVAAAPSQPPAASDDEALAAVPLPAGKENTTIRAQNVSSGEATIAVDFRGEDGAIVGGANQTVLGVQPAASVPFSQVTNNALQAGFFGSAVVVSDRPLETLVLREIAESTAPGSLRAWSAYGFSEPSRRLLLPVLYADIQGLHWDSRVAVVNNSEFTGCFSVLYRGLDGEEELAGPGSSACPNGGFELPSRGQVTLDGADFPAVVAGKPFSAVIDSVATSTDAYAEFSAYVDVYRGDGGRNLGSYEAAGVGAAALTPGADDPGDSAGTTILVPLVQNANRLHSTIVVQNAAPDGRPAEITLTYHSPQLSGGQKVVSVSGVVDVTSFAAMDAERGLPQGATGWAEITSTQPIVALLQTGRLGTQDMGLTVLPPSPADGAGLEWRLPLIVRNHDGADSWFRVLVVGGGAANLQIETASDPGDPCYVSPQTLQIEIAGALTFDQGAGTGTAWNTVPACFSGGAIIRSDVPVVVLAGATRDSYSGDHSVLYTGATP